MVASHQANFADPRSRPNTSTTPEGTSGLARALFEPPTPEMQLRRLAIEISEANGGNALDWLNRAVAEQTAIGAKANGKKGGRPTKDKQQCDWQQRLGMDPCDAYVVHYALVSLRVCTKATAIRLLLRDFRPDLVGATARNKAARNYREFFDRTPNEWVPTIRAALPDNPSQEWLQAKLKEIAAKYDDRMSRPGPTSPQPIR